MNDFFTQLKKETEHIRLSEVELSRMRDALHAAMEYAPARTMQRDASKKGLFPKVLAIALSGALLAGGSVAYAAEGALPGDSLYSVKVGVNEKVFAAVAVSPEAKVEWHERATERRIEELAKLAYAERLTPEVAQELEVRIEEHSTEGEMIASETEEPARAARLAARFAAARSVARTLSRATERGVESEGGIVVAAMMAVDTPQPATLSMRAFTKSDMSLEMARDTEREDTSFVEGLENEAEHVVRDIQERIQERKVSTTTKQDTEERVIRLKERVESVRERRERGDIESSEHELRDVLERGSELDVALNVEEKAIIEIVPRLPR